jgi:8-oxo-dGTP pyrophosphatase MutT (NUDIX family)
MIARAVIRRGGRVLLARSLGASWWFLPGGHVEPDETVEAALVRELAEELGTDARIDRLLGVVENSYRSDDGAHHELNHVFEVTLAEEEPASRESHLEFRWLPRDELAAADLRPDAIKQMVL